MTAHHDHEHEPDEAEVVDLAAARHRHTDHPDTAPDRPAAGDPDTDMDGSDSEADTDADSGMDTDEDALPVRVDSPAVQRPGRAGLSGWAGAERHPILPAWAKSRTEARQAAGWAVGFVAHTSGYHGVRVPKYATKLAARAPRGGYRLCRGWLWWLLDLSGEPVRSAAVRREDADQYLSLVRSRDRRVRWRGIVTTVRVRPHL